MTLPVGSYDPDDLPQGVVKPTELGSALQDQSAAKFQTLAASRFPAAVGGTSAGSPANVGGPLGFVVKLFSNFTNKVATADPATIRKPDDLAPLANPFLSGLPLTSLLSDLIDAIKGIFTGGNPLLAAISALMAMRWEQVDDLQDKTQKLEGVIGYGCRYMSSSPGVNTSPAVMPFDTQVGPAVGVTLQSGGRYRLDSKGLWRFEAQTYFATAPLAPPRCFMDIVIRTPGGAEFARLKAMGSTDQGLTITNVMPVAIPTAGYTVEVQAWTSGLPLFNSSWRSISGGLGNTRFSVFKISTETS